MCVFGFWFFCLQDKSGGHLDGKAIVELLGSSGLMAKLDADDGGKADVNKVRHTYSTQDLSDAMDMDGDGNVRYI